MTPTVATAARAATGQPVGAPAVAVATHPSGRRARAGRAAVRAVALLTASALLVVVVAVSLAVGAKSVPLGEVVRAFVDFDGSTDHLVIRQLRLPRTIVGVLVGAALGVAGALMQAITRNPLADPGLLGVNAGAALAVVLSIWALGVTSLGAHVWFAFVGAAVTSVVVFVLGSLGRGGATPVRLALAGAALSALLASFTTAITIIDRQTLDQFRFWAVGSLAGRDLDTVAQVAPFIIVGLVLALAAARPLNTLGLGEDTARALGTNIGFTRALTALGVTLLCGAATAAVGPIAFIGLVVPLAARMITGPDQRWLIPMSAVLGPIVLVACDVVGRVIARPGEVQVGIMTAAIGGPTFVLLVRRVRMAQL